MEKRILKLDQKRRQELEEMRDHHPTAYLRERAAAMLKIADGMSAHAVACGGLLRRRKADTVYEWLNAYEAKGREGLTQGSRRGKKLFSG